MSYFAAIFAHAEQGWVGTQADLSDVQDAGDLTDLLREAAVETEGDPVLMLVEEDDEWFAITRLDGEEDPRAFISDALPLPSRLGQVFGQLIEEGAAGAAKAAVPEGHLANGEVSGDAALLEDLGAAAKALLELSDRALPSDALLVVAEQAGFAAEFDQLRD